MRAGKYFGFNFQKIFFLLKDLSLQGGNALSVRISFKRCKDSNSAQNCFLHFSFKNAPDCFAAKRQLKKVQISVVIIINGCTSSNASREQVLFEWHRGGVLAYGCCGPVFDSRYT